MNKMITVKEAYENSKNKLPELKKKSGLTDEQIDILYAVASANSMYYFDVTDVAGRNVYSVKMRAIRNLLKIFGSDCDLDFVNKLMVSIYSCELYKFFSFDEDEFYVFADIYYGETALFDIDYVRTRFIFNKDGSLFYKLFEDITVLGYTNYDREEARDDFKEIDDYFLGVCNDEN